MEHESTADITEAPLVKRLVSDSYWRSTVFNVKGLESGSDILLCVPQDGLPGTPVGDVDILLVPPGHPERAAAFEVKRIKVKDGDANKLHEFKKGVQQVNRLAAIGFHQTYLYVLVAVDSRGVNSGRYCYDDGMSPELKGQIHQLISAQHLAAGVGLMHQEFVQPMDSAPFGVGSYGGHLVKLAEPKIQPAEVTQWVEARVAERAA